MVCTIHMAGKINMGVEMIISYHQHEWLVQRLQRYSEDGNGEFSYYVHQRLLKRLGREKIKSRRVRERKREGERERKRRREILEKRVGEMERRRRKEREREGERYLREKLDDMNINWVFFSGWSYRARIQSVHATNISVERSDLYSQRFSLDTRRGETGRPRALVVRKVVKYKAFFQHV